MPKVMILIMVTLLVGCAPGEAILYAWNEGTLAWVPVRRITADAGMAAEFGSGVSVSRDPIVNLQNPTVILDSSGYLD